MHLKKEVSVKISPPNYALFYHSATPGSMHDYQRLKSTYTEYIPYLKKLPDEIIEGDSNHYWSALFDKGYVGPDTDTPNLRRLTEIKEPKTMTDAAFNTELKTKRVLVECFFGRLKTLFRMARDVYRYDLSNFDVDLDCCIC